MAKKIYEHVIEDLNVAALTAAGQMGMKRVTLTNGDTETTQTFAMNVNRITNKLATMLIDKNLAYGDSALNPVRIFSKADRMEQLYTRLDDKISRVQRGHEYPGDDTIQDIIGYCILVLIARESE